MAVTGVLVDAKVRNEHDRVTELFSRAAERYLHDSFGIPCTRTFIVFLGRYAEENDCANTDLQQILNLCHRRGERVLHHTRKRNDWLWLTNAFSNKDRGDQVVSRKRRLCDNSTEGISAAKTT